MLCIKYEICHKCPDECWHPDRGTVNPIIIQYIYLPTYTYPVSQYTTNTII